MKKNDDDNYIRVGKIKVIKNIGRRVPVLTPPKRDKNRELMIKFKYGMLTDMEETIFHDAIKKLIYKVMHSNNVMMDWDDVYQEIWKKIVNCRHTWNESHGTMVSTWITIVANSVINTLKKNVGRYKSRYVLYDDLIDEDDSRNSNEVCDIIADHGRSIETDPMESRIIWNEQYGEFLSMLSDAERSLIETAKTMDAKFSGMKKSRKPPLNELRKRLGYDTPTFNALMVDIRQKIAKVFGNGFLNVHSEKIKSNGEQKDKRDGTICDLFLF